MALNIKNKIFIIISAVIAAIAILYNLNSMVKYLLYNLLQLPADSHLSTAIEFFVFEVPKVLILLVLIIFFIGIIQSFFSAERTRQILEGKPLFLGNILAACLGIVTPFCSCSAIPLFLGFVEAGIPLGVTFSFLIAAPLINEIAIFLLLAMFGWQVTALYIGTGLLIAIFAGWIIGKLHLEKYIESWVFDMHSNQTNSLESKLTISDRIDSGLQSVKDILFKVWLYIVIGIAVGAGIHGFVPQNFMAALMGKQVWYSVPISILIGIPLYSNAAGIIPIVQALLAKGASLGTSLAFMMSVIGLSLPEMIILKKVLKLKLIFIFVSIVGFGIMIVGYLFNLII